MIRKVIGLILGVCCVVASHAQTRKVAHHKKKIPVYELELMHVTDKLQADSVKIYSFSCGTPITPPTGIMLTTKHEDEMLPALLIDSTQHWAYTIADTGKMIKSDDLTSLLKLLKYSYLDTIPQPKPRRIHGDLVQEVILNEPTGCYEPRMGIMFFKDGMVQAHIDVCLQCGKLEFETFANGHVAYKFHMGILHPKIEPFLNALCVNYQLLCCKMR